MWSDTSIVATSHPHLSPAHFVLLHSVRPNCPQLQLLSGSVFPANTASPTMHLPCSGQSDTRYAPWGCFCFLDKCVSFYFLLPIVGQPVSVLLILLFVWASAMLELSNLTFYAILVPNYTTFKTYLWRVLNNIVCLKCSGNENFNELISMMYLRVDILDFEISP